MNTTKKAIIIVSILLPLLLGTAITTIQAATTQSANKVFLGLSGYPTSTTQIDNIINTMQANGLNTYRMSFNPQWSSGPHPYRENYIQYFLDHSTFNIIVDRNHLYPPTEASATTARNNWATVRSSVFDVLEAYPNNPRVMVELINEYISSDFYSRMQSLVTEIRAAGYTNPIVVDKWNQGWTVINDPLGSTYQGYHFYFNSWSPSGAISQMQTAQSKGIKVINTEIGADYNEYNSYTTSTVSELNTFLSQCASMGIGNTIWMNENLNNMPKYQQLGLKIPSVTAPTQPTPTTTPTPTQTPTPTSTPTPTPTTPTNTVFTDNFESRSLSNWNKITRTYGEKVSISSNTPYDGSYGASFTTTGKSYGRENAYLSKSINMQNVYARGYFYFSSSTGRILSDNGDRLYLISFSNSNGELAYAGIRRENGVNKWVLYANGAKTSSAISVSVDRYYSVELRWNAAQQRWNAAQQTVQMLVDGTKILETTASSNSVTTVNMGIISTYNVQNSLEVYGDSFTISNL